MKRGIAQNHLLRAKKLPADFPNRLDIIRHWDLERYMEKNDEKKFERKFPDLQYKKI